VWISSSNFGGYFIGFIFYFLTALLLCLLSTFACQALGKEAEGSGIPQMKSILSGFYDREKDALKLRVLGAKSLGLICAIGGGLPVGWEGPNVHIACIISHQLSRLPFFRFIRRDKSLRLQMIGAACAVGLASSFGMSYCCLFVFFTWQRCSHRWSIIFVGNYRFVLYCENILEGNCSNSLRCFDI